MYIPENTLNEKIYVYDVNSLYPFIMQTCLMPTKSVNYFEGNIIETEPNAFGFFYCNIISPDDLQYPVLQTHVKTKGGVRTMSALGTYQDWIFSEEMKFAQSLGYKFEIIKGYTFDKELIFKDYITKLYEIRLMFPKSDPMNLIAKLIMNSLYGRFGMDDSFSTFKIVNKLDYIKFEKEYINSIVDVKELGNKYLIEMQSDLSRLNTMLDNGSENHNVNIAIASSIASYARIHLNKLIHDLLALGYKVYYKDTDSIFVNKPIPEELISQTELGKLKLENICSRAIFIAPKVYCLVTEDGREIFKVKGLTKNVKFSVQDFESLLIKNNKIERNQTKWFKSLESGTITVKDQLYSLKITDNKRQLIYSNNKLVSTKPYIINNEKIVNNDKN